MQINGFYFEAGDSTRLDARLEVNGSDYQLFIHGDEPARTGSLHELDISDRIGNIARKIYWPDQALFESDNNDRIDQLLKDTGHASNSAGVLHKLESSGKTALIALVAVLALSVLFFRYGLPATATFIASKMPIRSAETISTGAMQALDKLMFEQSEISETEQARWQERFDTIISQVPNEGFTFKLHFRNMRGIPNALALPGGDIVVTDAFLKLVDDTGEFDAVLLHEIGHVVERHGLKQTVQASAVSVLVALAFGDASGLGELVVSFPVFILESSYSRQAEASADEYSFEQLARLGIDPSHFASIILKLSDETLTDTDKLDEGKINEYGSTHPDSKRRALRALELSKEFNQ